MAQQPFIFGKPYLANSIRPPQTNTYQNGNVEQKEQPKKKKDKIIEPIDYDKVDPGTLTYMNMKNFPNGGFNQEIQYNGGPFKIRTPPLTALFGVSGYQHNDGDPIYYSINLGIPEEVTSEFMQIMERIDFCCDQTKTYGDTYMSFIKFPKVGKPGLKHLRVKLRSKPIRGQPDQGEKTKLMLSVNLPPGKNGVRKSLKDPTVEELRKYLLPSTKCSAILRLCSFWRNCNGSCGCSWDTNKIELF